MKSDFFDGKYYLKENPDVAKAKANPILHYLQFGWKEGRNPSTLFNTNYYISFRPDIVKADICPLVHYELFGKKEFLSFCFDKIKYLEKKISDLDNKYGQKTADLDNKFEKKTTDLDTKFGKKTADLDNKFEKKTTDLDTKFGKKTADLEKFKNDILFTYSRGINKEKISYEIENFLNSSELGIIKEKRELELIISLTSYPDRMYDICYTLYSLFKQNLKPNKIILFLAEEQFPNRDKDLHKKLLEFTKHGLIVKYTKDIKSYKKLIPALNEYPNALIVTADDDIFYPQDWLEKLYNCWKDNKNYIICHRAHRIIIKGKKIIPYNNWEQEIITEKSSFLHFLTGVGGVLYPPNFLYKDVLNEKLFQKLSPNADDIWFWAMAVLNDKKIKIVDDEPFNKLIYINPEREIGLNDDITLLSLNIYKNENDIQFEQVINHYPQIMEKLLNE